MSRRWFALLRLHFTIDLNNNSIKGQIICLPLFDHCSRVCPSGFEDEPIVTEVYLCVEIDLFLLFASLSIGCMEEIIRLYTVDNFQTLPPCLPNCHVQMEYSVLGAVVERSYNVDDAVHVPQPRPHPKIHWLSFLSTRSIYFAIVRFCTLTYNHHRHLQITDLHISPKRRTQQCITKSPNNATRRSHVASTPLPGAASTSLLCITAPPGIHHPSTKCKWPWP